MLTAEQVMALEAGGLYFNVHTEAHPDGEVRGQIVPSGASFAESELAAEYQVPPNGSEATGAGTALVDADGLLVATVVTEGVDDATMAHIHTGAAGENGDILVGLEQDPTDPPIWRTPEGANLDGAGRAAFDAQGLYFDVHTPEFPDGEIRGQLCPPVPGGVTGDCGSDDDTDGDTDGDTGGGSDDG